MPAPGKIWVRLGPAQPEEWLYVFPEQGETFLEYRERGPVRPTPTRRTVYVKPWLTRPLPDPLLLERMRDTLAAFFGARAALLPPSPLPEPAYDHARRQYSVSILIAHLAETLPDDALFLIAVTDRDLRAPGLSHLYGWASLDRRVGVISLARLLDAADPMLFRRRALSLAAHEAGHMLSMAHCIFYRCLMNGCMSLAESDARPFLLCPVCSAKLAWNVGTTPAAHYRAMQQAFETQGLARDSDRNGRAYDLTRSQ
ncbi:MAG: archaemetzincin [Planctomycetaceae bacterium]